MPDGIDQSWGFADPKQAAAAGVKVVSMYLSNDPSKNATHAKVTAYHAAGIGVLLNWESQAGAPLSGAGQGAADGAEAVRQAQALGAPDGTIIYFSCDTDTQPGQYPSIDAYYRAAGHPVRAAGYGVGCYGEADLVHHLSAAGLTDAEWQTIAWSGGRLDPAADFYQTGINDTLGGASVDFDRIIHPNQLGAWWPPNSPYGGDTVTPAQMQQILDAITAATKAAQAAPHDTWAYNQGGKTAQAWALLQAAANPAATAKAILAQLPPAATGGLTEADIETALKNVFAAAAATN